jgi:hypothetical protein
MDRTTVSTTWRFCEVQGCAGRALSDVWLSTREAAPDVHSDVPASWRKIFIAACDLRRPASKNKLRVQYIPTHQISACRSATVLRVPCYSGQTVKSRNVVFIRLLGGRLYIPNSIRKPQMIQCDHTPY